MTGFNHDWNTPLVESFKVEAMDRVHQLTTIKQVALNGAFQFLTENSGSFWQTICKFNSSAFLDQTTVLTFDCDSVVAPSMQDKCSPLAGEKLYLTPSMHFDFLQNGWPGFSQIPCSSSLLPLVMFWTESTLLFQPGVQIPIVSFSTP